MQIDWGTITPDRLADMRAAGETIVECYRVLAKGGANVVGEVLKGGGEFVQWDHYPEGDIYDNETHSQYYYHAHRDGEHGHFHTFLRRSGIPEGIVEVANDTGEAWPDGGDALSHLIAISMDAYGFPVALFTTNRWVTGETWFRGEDVIRMLDRFDIDHAVPNWATNRWISAMVRLYRPQIEVLVRGRDRSVAEWSPTGTEIHVLEDRELEITSYLPISVEDQLDSIRAEHARRGIA